MRYTRFTQVVMIIDVDELEASFPLKKRPRIAGAEMFSKSDEKQRKTFLRKTILIEK